MSHWYLPPRRKNMANDSVGFKLEDDGTWSIETDKISPVNHKSGDDVIRFFKTLAGGTTTVKKKTPHGHVHHKNEQKVGR